VWQSSNQRLFSIRSYYRTIQSRLSAWPFRLSKHPLGSEISLEYRVDAEDMTPVTGVIKCKVPDNEADIVSHK